MEISKIGFITFNGKFEDGSFPFFIKEDGCLPCGNLDSGLAPAIRPTSTPPKPLEPRSFLPNFPTLCIRPPLSFPSPLKDGSFPYMSALYGRDELLRSFLIQMSKPKTKPKSKAKSPSKVKTKKNKKKEVKGEVALQNAILACSSSEELALLLASPSSTPRPLISSKTKGVEKGRRKKVKMVILRKLK